MASGPIPKFVSARGILRYELRNLRTTSNSMNLVRLLNLRFLNELAATNDRNLKFAALGAAACPADAFECFAQRLVQRCRIHRLVHQLVTTCPTLLRARGGNAASDDQSWNLESLT